MSTVSGVGNLLVVDLGVGMSAALAAKLLADTGARVVRIEPSSGDPFYDVYPAYSTWRSKAQLAQESELQELLLRADVCIVGGESYPGLDRRFDGHELHAAHPHLIVLDLGGAHSMDGVAAPAVDILAQARTGLVYEQFTARPICLASRLPTYGATLVGLIGVWAALLQRRRSGRGELVKSSLEQGVGIFWSAFWIDAERPDTAFSTITPKDCRHLIFECADGGYVQFVMGIPSAVAKLYKVLGIDAVVDPNDRGVPRVGAPIDEYFGNLKLIGAHVIKFERSALLKALWNEGLAAEPVLQPGECWSDPQIEANALIETGRNGCRSVACPIDFAAAASLATQLDAPVAPPGPDEGTGLPLAGVRIIDLGNFVAGPYASRLLGDLGADVIKVQPPSGASTISGYRTVYSSNCNKRGLCINIKSDEGLKILRGLCRTADVVHHNFRVGVAERIGVAPHQLRKVNPNLVTLETSAYGKVGPKSLLAGFDMVMQAWCGHEARAGGIGNPPLWVRSPLVDYAAGAIGAIAILMGLYRREVNGHGVEATVSLLASSLFLQSELIWSPDAGFKGAGSIDKDLTGFHPAESLYRTRNGWIALALRGSAMAFRFTSLLQLHGFSASTADWGDVERSRIGEALRSWDCAELVQALRAHEVWVEPCVQDGWASLTERRNGALGRQFKELLDPHYGRVSGIVGTLVEFGDTATGDRHLRSAPAQGQHTRELLRELGYTPENISKLAASGVVAGADLNNLAAC
ncbi:CaiB/BaiF CoA-transferase family protein [Noviherbaspirillum sedimenti]|uniref:CoA transferase n=1 Tax=Noviherbaspirillum sedimenti TaxID=2320865 RepID=A0A3A3GLD8_9BURK|nr:CoA transferase [Noviherbaspirillum sedimenti]RJG03086.1 hypothetical protein D3878_17115 [Noviherbaspirillum sedimenti]